jgi:hypothetical protein
MSVEQSKINTERRTLYLKKLVEYERRLLDKLKQQKNEKDGRRI